MSFVKNEQFRQYFKSKYGQQENSLFASVVTEGELDSLIMQHKWGRNKRFMLDTLFSITVIAPIKTEEIIKAYAEIDAYSQGKHPTLNLPTSARNMGKNDVWIAATASALELTLITTDKDFDHLNGVFLNVVWIDIKDFSSL
jgi:predicted nucleic acid-binding protein